MDGCCKRATRAVAPVAVYLICRVVGYGLNRNKTWRNAASRRTEINISHKGQNQIPYSVQTSKTPKTSFAGGDDVHASAARDAGITSDRELSASQSSPLALECDKPQQPWRRSRNKKAVEGESIAALESELAFYEGISAQPRAAKLPPFALR